MNKRTTAKNSNQIRNQIRLFDQKERKNTKNKQQQQQQNKQTNKTNKNALALTLQSVN